MRQWVFDLHTQGDGKVILVARDKDSGFIISDMTQRRHRINMLNYMGYPVSQRKLKVGKNV